MPQLDVGHVARDPRFSEPLTIYRRMQVVTNGIVSFNETLISPAPYGTVTQDRNDLVRGPDEQHMPRRIVVVCPYRLRSASAVGAVQYQPDRVVWRGDSYVVDEVDDYTAYGHGFVQAKCSSIDYTDQAPQ